MFAECTFTPTIKDLPRAYGGGRRPAAPGAPFYDRALQWQREAALARERLAAQRAAEEMAECTFRPAIARASERAVERARSLEARGGMGSGPSPPRRLDLGASPPRGLDPGPSPPRGRGRSAGPAPVSAGARLFEEHRLKEERRERRARAARREEAARHERECSFRPDLSLSAGSRRSLGRAGASSGDSGVGQPQGAEDTRRDLSTNRSEEGIPRRPRGRSAPPARRRPWGAGPGAEGYRVSLHRVGVSEGGGGGGGVGASVAWKRSSAVARAPMSAVAQEAEARRGARFRPEVKGASRSMRSAREYLREDVVRRLTRVPNPPGAAPEDPSVPRAFVTALASPYAAPRGRSPHPTGSAGAPRPRSAGERRKSFGDRTNSFRDRRNSFGDRTNSFGDRTKSLEDRTKSFQDFLSRQESQRTRAAARVERALERSTPQFRPRLCRGTESLMEVGGRRGSFFERLAAEEVRRRHAEVRGAARARDPEATFRPEINRRSAARGARSALDMSRGDHVRQITRRRLLKLKTEQRERRDATFRPKLQTRHRGMKTVEGWLRLSAEPGTYVDRLRLEATLRGERRAKAEADRERKEMEGCTFKPTTHDCPAYVRRIAESMKVAREARPPQRDARPEWR